jgi:hypothetical protein
MRILNRLQTKINLIRQHRDIRQALDRVAQCVVDLCCDDDAMDMLFIRS